MKKISHIFTLVGLLTFFWPISSLQAQTPQVIDTYYHYNSLHNHLAGEGNTNTRVSHWVFRMAEQSTASNTYSIAAKFGFFTAWTLPPHNENEHGEAESPHFGYTPTWTGAQNIEVVGFVPDNFDGQAFDPASTTNMGADYQTTILNLIDQWESNAPNANRRYVIYAGWPRLNTYGAANVAALTPANIASWIEYGLGDYQDWMELLESRLQAARPGLDIRLHNISKSLLTTYRDSVVSTIPATTLFEDLAPHGRPSWYFMAAVAEYIELFGEKPPANFVFDEAWGVNATVIDNYQIIVDAIWDVIQTGAATPMPVITFSALDNSLTEGATTTLTWSATNATSCTASNGWSGAQATSSSLVISPTATTTYTLTCTGAGGSDVESVTVTVSDASVVIGDYPALNSAVGLSDPSLSYGLGGVEDYSTIVQFLDLMKVSRPFLGHLSGQWGGITHQQLKDGGYLDANGWPTSIPSNATKISTIWDWGAPVYGSEVAKAGNYVMTYEGQGTFALLGVQNEVRTPGRVTFSITGMGGIALDITATQEGDHLRNIVIVKEEYEDLYKSGAIFNPEYLEIIKDARQIRFKDWGRVDNSTWDDWSDMTPYTYSTWNAGVPIEVMVRLANEIGADPWFSIPFHVNDQFVENYAEYVRDNLDPDLVATVEYSNEVWNWIYEQANAAGDLAETEFGVVGGSGWINYYGKRASEVMKIWTDVFGSETSTRLIRAAGVQTNWTELTPMILNAPMWQTADPTNYVAPKTYFDAIAGTTYFGGREVSNEAVRNELLAQIALPGDAYDWNEQLSREELIAFPDTGIPTTIANLQVQKSYADAEGLDLIVYEGGQHVHHSAFVSIPQEDLDALQEHLAGFVRSQQMADLYQTLWDQWMLVGDGPFMQFVEIGKTSVYGSWGLRDSFIDNSPRSLLIDSLNASTPAWWESRGGNRFRQGVITTATQASEQLVGTSKTDYLIGNNTDNIFYPGGDDDGVNGGGGTDTVLLLGNRSEYTVTAEGEGYRVVGPDGSDYLYDIDILNFSDTSVSVEDALDPDPVPVLTFSVTDNSITEGSSVTLTWSTLYATACTASNGWSGSRSTAASLVVTPTNTTTYTLTCTGLGGSDVESLTVTVTAASSGGGSGGSSGGGGSTSSGGGGGGGGSSTTGPKFTKGQNIILVGATEVKDANLRNVLGTAASSTLGKILSSKTKTSNRVKYYQVSLNGGLTGWVAVSKLALYEKSTVITTVSTETIAPVRVPITTSATPLIVSTDRINIRQSPGGEVIDQKPVGSYGYIQNNVAPVVRGGYTWIYVKFDATTGYVAKEFTKPATAIPAPPRTNVVSNTTPATIDPATLLLINELLRQVEILKGRLLLIQLTGS